MHIQSFLLLSVGLLGSVKGIINNQKIRQNQLLAELGLRSDGTNEAGQLKINTVNDGPQAAAIVAETVELKLDHFGDGAGTFRNRFWVSDKFYKPGSPVFIYDAGEGNAEPGANLRLDDDASFFKQLIQKYSGLGIVWEHRFYGESTPVKINLDTPAEAFKYHTAEQALADIPAFAWNFTRANFPGQDFTPKSTPWVFVGGSYPGMRAAFVRNKYPETIYASWASSAPVEASVDMSFYWEPVWRGLNAYGFGNCTQDIKAAILSIDDTLADDAAAAALKEKFLGIGTSSNSNAGFADALSTIFYGWQSYGVGGGYGDLGQFCDWIAKDPATNKTSPAEGWAATKGVSFTIDRWASWPYWIDNVNSYMYTNCSGPQAAGANPAGSAATCNLDARFADPDAIGWTWQYCTEWGYLQYANVGDHQLISKYNSRQHQLDICQRQFPDGKSSGLLPDVPQVEATNQKFGGWNIRPSQTLWTGGQFDPWRTLSPLSDLDFAPGFQTTSEIPACASTDQSAAITKAPSSSIAPLFSFIVPNAQHCYDFRTSVPQAKPAQALFDSSLDKWLQCYTPAGNATVALKPSAKFRRGLDGTQLVRVA